MNNINKKVLAAVSAVILVIVGIVTTMSLTSKDEQKKTANDLSKEEIRSKLQTNAARLKDKNTYDWKIYMDEENDFYFIYPNNMEEYAMSTNSEEFTKGTVNGFINNEAGNSDLNPMLTQVIYNKNQMQEDCKDLKVNENGAEACIFDVLYVYVDDNKSNLDQKSYVTEALKSVQKEVCIDSASYCGTTRGSVNTEFGEAEMISGSSLETAGNTAGIIIRKLENNKMLVMQFNAGKEGVEKFKDEVVTHIRFSLDSIKNPKYDKLK